MAGERIAIDDDSRESIKTHFDRLMITCSERCCCCSRRRWLSSCEQHNQQPPTIFCGEQVVIDVDCKIHELIT